MSNAFTLTILTVAWRILSFVRKRAIHSIPLLIVTALWELIARTRMMGVSALPPFTVVVAASFDLFLSGEVFLHLFISLYRALLGLAIGSTIGLILGIAMARSSLIYDMADPLITLTYPLPKTAFIPIAILWLGVGNASVIMVVTISTLMPMVISAYQGTQSVPPQFLWLGQSMGASRLRMFSSILLPATMVYLANGLRIGLGFAIVVVISTEMFAAHIGIGKFIFLYGESGNYDYMFATISIIICAAFLLDRIFLLCRQWLLPWEE